jgi:SepF-like predicted cell division protein (DUF552 family)
VWSNETFKYSVNFSTIIKNSGGECIMVKFFSKIKEKLNNFVSTEEESKMLSETEEDYVELDTEKPGDKKKVIVRTYNIGDFTELKPVLDHLREGLTIAIINIKSLKDKDLVELKRSINKLKKTTDALGGDIAGFGEDYIIVTPGIAKVFRGEDSACKPEELD